MMHEHPPLHRLLACLFLLAFQAHCLFSQDWIRDYQLGANASAVAVMRISDGGFVAAGRLGNGNEGQPYLLKVGPEGDSLWMRSYEPMVSITDATATPDAGFVMIGSKNNVAFLLKTDSLGNTLWQQSLDETVTQGLAVAADWQGNILVAGNRSAHPYLAKLDPMGNLLWEKSFDDKPAPVRAGGDAERGFAYAHFDGASTIYFLRTDAEGNERWYNSFSSPSSMFIYDITPNWHGGLAMVGAYFVPQTDSAIAFRLLTNDNGSSEQSNGFCCGIDDYANARSIVEVPNGYAILWGYYSLAQTGCFLMGVPGIDTLPSDFQVHNIHPNGLVFAGRTDIGLRLMNLEHPWPVSTSNELIKTHTGLTVYPNPTSGELWVELDLNADDVVTIFATNAQGNHFGLLLDEQCFPAGKHQLTLNTMGWQSGLYFLHLYGKTGNQIRRLVKLE